jgi:CRP-like cAMP-binding protein
MARPGELVVPKGTILFQQGDPGDEMFVVAAGRVRLTLSEEGRAKEIDVLGPGDFFGELSLLNGAPRTATAEVQEDATLLRIRRETFAMMMQDDLQVVFRMMNVLGQRLSQANAQVRGQMLRLGQVQALAHCLRRCLAAPAPVAVELDELARTLGARGEDVRALAAEAAARGIGGLRDGQWVFESGHVARLAEELCRRAEGPPPGGSR